MTPKELKRARKTLGLSVSDFCLAFGIGNERTLRGWELGFRGDKPAPIPKPVQLLVRLALSDQPIDVREWLADEAGFPPDHESEYDE